MQDNPLTGTQPPPIDGISPWWDLFVALFPWLISGVVAGACAVWAAVLQYYDWKRKRDDKLIDKDSERVIQAEQRKQALELEELKQSFDQRQKMFEMLQGQLKEQLEEGRLMRKELADAREELNRRDIASRSELQTRDNTISELKATIVTLNQRISHLEREVKQMEQSNALHLRQAHSTGVTTP
jgi:predicted RNase H-like nuclease (RuvC/YqgF family)